MPRRFAFFILCPATSPISITSSPLVRVTVFGLPGMLKMIVSPFCASSNACRKLPVPLSAGVGDYDRCSGRIMAKYQSNRDDHREEQCFHKRRAVALPLAKQK